MLRKSWSAWVIGLLAIGLAFVLLQRMGLIGWGSVSSSGSSSGGAREYGTLGADLLGRDSDASSPSRSVSGSDPTSGETPAQASARTLDTSPPSDDGNAEGLRPGQRFSVAGRPAHPFDPELLERIGLDTEKAAGIQADFEALLEELRGPDPDARIRPPITKTPEERERDRRLKERYLDAYDYDAALFATRQANRAYFKTGPKPGSSAARAGVEAGDEIIEINGIRVFDLVDFTDGRDLVGEGDLHRLVIARRGKLMDLTLKCCHPGWGGVVMRPGRPLDAERAP